MIPHLLFFMCWLIFFWFLDTIMLIITLVLTIFYFSNWVQTTEVSGPGFDRKPKAYEDHLLVKNMFYLKVWVQTHLQPVTQEFFCNCLTSKRDKKYCWEKHNTLCTCFRNLQVTQHSLIHMELTFKQEMLQCVTNAPKGSSYLEADHR